MNLIILLAACFSFSMIVTYAYWTAIRVNLLQLDLATILVEFEQNWDRAEAPDSEHPGDFRDAIEQLIEGVPLLTPALIGRFSRIPEITLAGWLGADAEPFFEILLDPGPKSPALRFACWKIGVRVCRYLALETFSGWSSIAAEILVGPFRSESLDWDSPREIEPSREVIVTAARFLSRGQFRRTA